MEQKNHITKNHFSVWNEFLKGPFDVWIILDCAFEAKTLEGRNGKSHLNFYEYFHINSDIIMNSIVHSSD